MCKIVFFCNNPLSCFCCSFSVLSTTDVTLDSGSYSFPFKFVIPSRAPYTYNGGLKCNIRYYVKAVIHRNCKSDKSTTASFMVNSVLRLEYVPNSLVGHITFPFLCNFKCIQLIYQQQNKT